MKARVRVTETKERPSWPPADTIEQLLKLASVPDTVAARAALQSKLDWAVTIDGAIADWAVPVPRERYAQVAAAARKLRNAMRALDRHWQRRDGDWLEQQHREAAGGLLDGIVAAAAAKPDAPRGRSRPRRRGLQTIVYLAEEFWSQFSPTRATSYADGAFSKFAQRFAEVVTGGDVGSMEHQIRTALRRNQQQAKPAQTT